MTDSYKDQVEFFSTVDVLLLYFQCVCWMVCEQSKPISSSEMAAFRSLKDASGHTLNDNYRPVQALNERLLRTNILN